MTFVEPGFNKFDKRKLISAAFQAKMPLFLLQFIWIKIANNPLNTLHYLQKAHLSSDTKLIDLAD